MKNIQRTRNKSRLAVHLVLMYMTLCVLMPYSLSIAGESPRDTSGYSKFIEDLRQFFPNNKIIPLFSKLPDGGSIYGYDLGDLTGNGETDLVVSLKKPNTRYNDVFIYFFTSQGGLFELIKTVKRQYNEEPLEVAFYIEEGTCFLTDKVRDRHWRVDGYSIADFVFRQVYQWENHPLTGGRYGIQIESDYRTMKTTETLYKIETLSPLIKTMYLTVPAYPSGKRIPPDLPYVVSDSTYHMVLNGISNWFGPDDCSLSVFARYDSSELTLAAVVYDEAIIGGGDDAAADGVHFWLDCTGNDKLAYKQGEYVLGTDYSPGIIGIAVSAVSQGTFTRLTVRYSGFSDKEQAAIHRIHSSAVQLRGGARLIRCYIPWDVFGETIPEGNIGFAAAYLDIDSPQKRSWKSLLATSDRFEEGAAYSFGRLKLIGWNESPFERDDFRMRPLLKKLTNVGVLPR